MKAFRLIRSDPASAEYNMALDEKIFSQYLEDGIPVFRVYLWQAPSFTYGISKYPENLIDFGKCLSNRVQVVKRMTGGGILFHDDEITYSFVCSKEDVKEPQNVFVSYREICAFLIKFYESLGLKALFAKETQGFKGMCAPHELCSASHEKYDIVINNKKIGGNAQKRRRQAIFQHGSIPCSIDWDFVRRHLKNFPEHIYSGATSLSEELTHVPGKDILEQRLIDAFSHVFHVNFIEEKEILYEARMAG